MKKFTKKCFEEKLTLLVGGAAIYREGGLIKYVVVKKLDFDNDRVILTLNPKSSIGFSERLDSDFEISVSSESISIEKNYIHASYVNWCLVTHATAVTHLVYIAEKLNNVKELQEEYVRLRRRWFEVV